MTRTLQRAVKRIAALPAREQDAMARWMLRELADEARWDRNLSRSRAAVGRKARAALAEHKDGRTRRLDPDRL